MTSGRGSTRRSSAWVCPPPSCSARVPNPMLRPGLRRSPPRARDRTMTTIIEARGLTKNFRSTRALDHVSFSIETGRIVGLIGPNGAGKTTALKAMLGLTTYEGELKVLGRDPYSDRDALMREVCFIADAAVLPKWLRVWLVFVFVLVVLSRFVR